MGKGAKIVLIIVLLVAAGVLFWWRAKPYLGAGQGDSTPPGGVPGMMVPGEVAPGQ